MWGKFPDAGGKAGKAFIKLLPLVSQKHTSDYKGVRACDLPLPSARQREDSNLAEPEAPLCLSQLSTLKQSRL